MLNWPHELTSQTGGELMSWSPSVSAALVKIHPINFKLLFFEYKIQRWTNIIPLPSALQLSIKKASFSILQLTKPFFRRTESTRYPLMSTLDTRWAKRSYWISDCSPSGNINYGDEPSGRIEFQMDSQMLISIRRQCFFIIVRRFYKYIVRATLILVHRRYLLYGRQRKANR